MGMGPWAQGDFIRDTLKVERARFRRIVDRELKAVFDCKSVKLPDNVVIEMLERIKAKIAPAKPIRRRLSTKEIARAGGPSVDVFTASIGKPRPFNARART